MKKLVSGIVICLVMFSFISLAFAYQTEGTEDLALPLEKESEVEDVELRDEATQTSIMTGSSIGGAALKSNAAIIAFIVLVLAVLLVVIFMRRSRKKK